MIRAKALRCVTAWDLLSEVTRGGAYLSELQDQFHLSFHGKLIHETTDLGTDGGFLHSELSADRIHVQSLYQESGDGGFLFGDGIVLCRNLESSPGLASGSVTKIAATACFHSLTKLEVRSGIIESRYGVLPDGRSIKTSPPGCKVFPNEVPMAPNSFAGCSVSRIRLRVITYLTTPNRSAGLVIAN